MNWRNSQSRGSLAPQMCVPCTQGPVQGWHKVGGGSARRGGLGPGEETPPEKSKAQRSSHLGARGSRKQAEHGQGLRRWVSPGRQSGASRGCSSSPPAPGHCRAFEVSPLRSQESGSWFCSSHARDLTVAWSLSCGVSSGRNLLRLFLPL